MKNENNKKDKESKLSKQQIIFIAFVCLLIFSLLYTKFKDGHINPSKTITFEEVEEVPVTTEEIDYSDYSYVTEDVSTDENLSDSESEYEEESVDDFIDIPSSYMDEGAIEDSEVVEETPNYSKEPSGFYDELNSTVEDIAIVSDSNIDILLQGLVMGYISDCWFVTNQFLSTYANGFLPDVQSVEVINKDFNNNTAQIKVNGTDIYNVTFTIVDNAIDSLSLQRVEGE